MASARVRGADLVEIRLDHLAVFHPRRDPQLLLKNRPLPALVTYRLLVILLDLYQEKGQRTLSLFNCALPRKESAPGQPTISDLLNVYNIKQIGPDTKVFRIIGKPVGNSKSPILHNAAFRSVGFNAVYVPLLVDDLAIFLTAYLSLDFTGFRGAVNTIIRRSTDGKLVGYNTDYVGAISAIEDGIRGKDASISPLVGKTFIVIGAGGAGKALAYGARENGAKVVIANRSYERARELANLIGGCALTLAELEIFHPEDGMILANTTSTGMQPNIAETPLIKQALGSYAVVFDAVDTPKVTWLLREAEEAGATVVSGMEMFLRLAIGQFELFTGLAAPENLMHDIVATTETRTKI
ncbi:hypothetical protein OPV22_019446 [Ensete ventricosum]|uniref:Shikimate dehydrogenase (NADP(+)) n=1 Tax=Ensete ventricosum TaxID=4639 RepID=A0AAV8QMK6_ENSVE|nr:hypothetical protein OPV22_019446 [Ensete ventricosum]